MLNTKTFKQLQYFISVPLLIGVVTYLIFSGVGDKPKKQIFITESGTEITAEVVSKPLDLAKGLSNRDNLPYNEGMFFVFPQNGRHGIWMKEMRFSIDIIWLDQNYNVVDIQPNVSPDTFPQSFSPENDALYVLEVNAGWLNENQVTKNTKIIPKK